VFMGRTIDQGKHSYSLENPRRKTKIVIDAGSSNMDRKFRQCVAIA